MTDEPLDRQVEKLEAQGPRFVSRLSDANVLQAVILLTKAVLQLDKTSSRLAKVNISLTIVVVALAGIQLAVILLHH